jgi:hypothetical protein
MALNWQGRLHGARSEEEVVDIVRDFVAMFSPRDLADVPSRLWPAKMRDARDVTDYAYRLVRLRVDDEKSSSSTLDRLCALFSDATVRISQLKFAASVERERQPD